MGMSLEVRIPGSSSPLLDLLGLRLPWKSIKMLLLLVPLNGQPYSKLTKVSKSLTDEGC